MKRCSTCETLKHLTEYYSRKAHTKAKGDFIYHFPECKECTKKRTIKWMEDNPERDKKNRRRAERKPFRKEQYRKFNKRRAEEGKFLEWQRNNKDKLKEYRRKRALSKSHTITEEELSLLYVFANSSCMYCGMTEEESLLKFDQKLHKDHAINDGSNGIENCILACKSCNSSKHKKDWDEWYVNSDRYDEARYHLIIEWLDSFKNTR